MKVSFAWLKAVAPSIACTPDEAAEHLALRGAPVEGMESLGAGLEGIVVGRVESVRPHPDADRLSVCEVDGGDGMVQVVCGAPVIHEGACYPFAPPGVVLPGGLKLKKAKIRGEVSNGMLCSEKELELGRDQSGIMQLEGDFAPGTSLIEAMQLNDVRLDVEVTANRGDLLSHVGVARELAPGGVSDLTQPDVPGRADVALEFERAEERVEIGDVSISIEDPDLCHRYLGAVIRGVTVGPSPEWLASRLRAAGAQPINNVVDATNYAMLELGHPMHAFDLDSLSDHSIVVRRAGDGERFETLDGIERTLTSEMLMICDGKRSVAIGGVMGGQNSEVGPETTDVLLECAMFDPKSIRATRRALNLSTDASYRFERGVDPDEREVAIARCVEVILATAGGTLDGPVLDVCPGNWETLTRSLRLSRIEHVLGVPFTASEVVALLEPLGFGCTPDGEESVSVNVPGYRRYDVTREIDLIEEIARAHGFDNFPEVLGQQRPSSVGDDPLFRLESGLRAAMVRRGLLEAQNPSFAPETDGDVEVLNPVSVVESHLRGALLPGLIRNVEHNFARGARDVRLFEVGTVFARTNDGEAPSERSHVSAIVTGRTRPPHWSREDTLWDEWDLKSLMTEVLHLAYPGGTVVPSDGVGGTDGDLLTLYSTDDEVVGTGGLLPTSRIDSPAWSGPVWVFEISLPTSAPKSGEVQYDPLPSFPAVERDLALLVPGNVRAAMVRAEIVDACGDLLESATMFDLYEGDGVPDGFRSLAYRLRLQARDRTLTDKVADKAVSRVVKRLQESLSVEQRV